MLKADFIILHVDWAHLCLDIVLGLSLEDSRHETTLVLGL